MSLLYYTYVGLTVSKQNQLCGFTELSILCFESDWWHIRFTFVHAIHKILYQEVLIDLMSWVVSISMQENTIFSLCEYEFQRNPFIFPYFKSCSSEHYRAPLLSFNPTTQLRIVYIQKQNSLLSTKKLSEHLFALKYAKRFNCKIKNPIICSMFSMFMVRWVLHFIYG